MYKLKLAPLITFAILITYPSISQAGNGLTADVPVDFARAAAAKNKPFTLVYKTKKFTASAKEVSKWFKTKNSGDQTLLQLRPGAIYSYLNIHVSPIINKLGQASRFEFIDGHLHLIGPGSKGQIVDGDKTSLAIRSAIISGQSSATVKMKNYRPSVFSAQDFTKLSFPDHLTRGETNFAGSPANRVHNIFNATKKFNGLVLMPGEEFSFNQYLGTVDANNGYKPELVIKDNVTTPEYGGGICQVSTTAWRAALQSGLKVTERRNHSYPVSYYGAPGNDATVYAPSTDLKFVNDTGYPVYFKTKILGTKLIFDVYGTKANREVRINGPFTTNRQPDGSITAAIAQFVKVGGKTIREKNFVSQYQSPNKFPQVIAANNG